ncbi:class I SAM-dependent methyltransferase, partial [candidate division KSB1 bacterium]
MNEVSWNKAFEKYESPEKKKKKNLDRLKKSDFFNDINKTEKILDLFSGTGDTLTGLKEKGYKNLFGGDLSLELVRIARQKNPIIRFLVMDAVSPP